MKRDFFSWTTYRTAAITQVVGILIGVFSWGIGAAYVQRPVQEMYGSDYVSFLLVGVAVSNLVMPLVLGVQNQLNPWTLETIFFPQPDTRHIPKPRSVTNAGVCHDLPFISCSFHFFVLDTW